MKEFTSFFQRDEFVLDQSLNVVFEGVESPSFSLSIDEKPVIRGDLKRNEWTREELQSLIYLVKKEQLMLLGKVLSITPELVISLQICTISTSFTNDSLDSSHPHIDKHMYKILCKFFPEIPKQFERDSNQNNTLEIHEIFQVIKPQNKDIKGTLPFFNQPKELIPQLRNYQLDAVKWMFYRETMEEKYFKPVLHPLWKELYSKEDEKPIRFYCNPFVGKLSMQKFLKSKEIRGGILADEMGLGKTLEILSLILLHQKPTTLETSCISKLERKDQIICSCGRDEEKMQDELYIQCDNCESWSHGSCVGIMNKKMAKSIPFLCHSCRSFVNEPDIEAKSTLIVCPYSILYQWRNEIAKHIHPGSLSVYIYEGVQKTWKSPSELAEYDIILTTYDVLRNDLHHICHQNSLDNRTRFTKRYQVIPTPLTKIVWWRICLDECQMVESNASKASEMALQLKSQYRWTISGTPLPHGHYHDLFHLLQFLGMEPYCYRYWWNRMFNSIEFGSLKQKDHLLSILKQVMWRNSKDDVMDELNLPPQSEIVHYLKFSPVEAYFYQKIHRQSASSIQMEISKFHKRNQRTSSHVNAQHETNSEKNQAHLDPKMKSRMKGTLLHLRQSCCHPQVVASSNSFLFHQNSSTSHHQNRRSSSLENIGKKSGSLRTLQKNVMTMEELLNSLILKAKIEYEESVRRYTCAVNGLAATLILKGEHNEALKLYAHLIYLSHPSLFKSSNPTQEKDTNQMNDSTISLENKSKEEKQTLHGNESLNSKNEQSEIQVETIQMESNQQENAQVEGIQVEVDPLQLYHTFVNMHSLLHHQLHLSHISFPISSLSLSSSSPSSLSGSQDTQVNVSTDLLENEAKRIQYRYTQKSLLQEKQSLQQVVEKKQQIQDILKDFDPYWFHRVLLLLSSSSSPLESQLLNKVKEELVGGAVNENAKNIGSIVRRFRDVKGLLFVLDSEWASLQEKRKKLLDSVIKSSEKSLETQLSAFQQCKHCQKNPDLTSICEQCYTHELFEDYEKTLFSSMSKQTDSTDSQLPLDENDRSQRRFHLETRKSTSDSEIEKTLKVIARFVAQHERKSPISHHSNLHFEMFDKMKKEFRIVRILWQSQKDRIHQADELEMAKMRIRFRYEDEIVAENETGFKIQPFELPQVEMKLIADKIEAKSEMTRNRGQISYLHSMQSQKTSIPSSPCSICYEEIGLHQVMLACGHVFCEDCIQTIIQRCRFTMKCPTCRQRVNLNEISYILEDISTSKPSKNDIQVKGSYGTKIEAIIRTLLKILSDQQTSSRPIEGMEEEPKKDGEDQTPPKKALVFCEWNEVLQIIGCALEENEISFLKVDKKKDMEKNLGKFRKDPSIHVLLLPIKTGSNGLNLIEATHVLLVAPHLHPAAELQAINRIYRIGQKYPTKVYRFVVKGTIEEKIYELGKKKMSKKRKAPTKIQKTKKITKIDDDIENSQTIGENKQEKTREEDNGANFEKEEEEEEEEEECEIQEEGIEVNKKETFDINDIQALFAEEPEISHHESSSTLSSSDSILPSNNTNPTPSSVSTFAPPSGPSLQQKLQDLFWGAKVEYKKNMMTRLQVSKKEEVAYSWECKEKGIISSQEPHLDLFGKHLPIPLIQSLLQLEEIEESEKATNEEKQQLLDHLMKIKENLNTLNLAQNGINT